MKWKIPDEGERRVSRGFALFPVITNDGYKVWLSWFWIAERYEHPIVAEYNGYVLRAGGWKRTSTHAEKPQ